MKLLLDQGLPRSAAALLRDSEIESVHVGEIGYERAEDRDILEYAYRGGFVVVTLDADFHSILALSGASSPSVIRIRIEGLRAQALVELLKPVLNTWNAQLAAGVALTVQPNRIRVRHLPIL
jgi:predicted nuclease of predicted toxin-antitoxin system